MPQYVTTPDGVRHTFPDEATPEQIKAALSGQSAPPMALTPESNPLASLGADLKGRALDALPTAGGFAGGLLGAAGGVPGMVAGAGIGGAAGEGLRQAGGGHSLDPQGIATEGGKQAFYELFGLGLAKGAGMAAKPIMKGAIRATKSIQSKFPDVVETALEYGLPATAGGAAKASALRRKSAKATTGILQGAKAQGKAFKPQDVVARADRLINNPALPNEDAGVIANQVANFLEQYKGDIDPVLLQDIKQIYQTRAIPGYAADAAGKAAAGQSPMGQFNKALAAGAREQLGTIPGVAKSDATTQSLIGAERALRDASMRHHPPFDIVRPGTYPGIRDITSQGNASRLALALNNQRFRALMRQSPRAAAELLNQAMYSAEPDATGQ